MFSLVVEVQLGFLYLKSKLIYCLMTMSETVKHQVVIHTSGTGKSALTVSRTKFY